jgi:hypothetical protein
MGARVMEPRRECWLEQGRFAGWETCDRETHSGHDVGAVLVSKRLSA